MLWTRLAGPDRCWPAVKDTVRHGFDALAVVRVIHVCCVTSAPLFESSPPKSVTFLHMLQLVFSCVPSREDEKLFAHQLLSLQWFHVSEPLVVLFGRSFLDVNG